MQQMGSPVETELVRSDQAGDFRVVVRKELRVAEQEPVENQHVERFQRDQHEQEPEEKLSEGKAVSDTVPSAADDRADKKEYGEYKQAPAQNVCSVKTFRLRLNGRLNILRGRGEQPLVLNQRDSGIEHQEERCHHDEGKYNSQKHGFELLNYDRLLMIVA